MTFYEDFPVHAIGFLKQQQQFRLDTLAFAGKTDWIRDTAETSNSGAYSQSIKLKFLSKLRSMDNVS